MPNGSTNCLFIYKSMEPDDLSGGFVVAPIRNQQPLFVKIKLYVVDMCRVGVKRYRFLGVPRKNVMFSDKSVRRRWEVHPLNRHHFHLKVMWSRWTTRIAAQGQRRVASFSNNLDPYCSRAIISVAWELTPRTEAGCIMHRTPFFLSVRFALVHVSFILVQCVF